MPGTVLLLAASPAGKGCLVDAASVLPVLAAVAPPVLSGTDTAHVVELADPLEPQAVLTRLRAAATAPGPLTLFLAGQLQLDRRQRLPHLALARTTPSTVRYTGLPWHWIREELRLRSPGTTAVFADLHADQEAWQQLRAVSLDCGPAVPLFGRIAPPPSRRAPAAPVYMKALATILRSGHRPDPRTLHDRTLARVYGESGVGKDIVLTPDLPMPGAHRYTPPTPPSPFPAPLSRSPIPLAPFPTQLSASPDPHAALTAAVQDGRHTEAAELAERWEQSALRRYGPGSEEVLHWMEVRADLAMLAGDAGLSCETWLAVANIRLSAGLSPKDPVVEAAVDRAHHQWGRIGDAVRAGELGPALADLRQRVPGRREGALNHVQEQLRRLNRQLQTQP
ncbi:hypothetical protein ABZ845_26570 [Streptomyces sp. NPDC047022]|uniref:hypothetical protein n=1 Tax=Streptomyces sp. NPDC047022 TaxID=3155737 RepID=UPI0033C84580